MAINFYFFMTNIKVTLLLIHKTTHLISVRFNYLNNVLMHQEFQGVMSSETLI